MKTRNGKIARLPLAVREELNHRLENGEPGIRLVAWLNRLPAVQAVLAAEFRSRPIREQNLSQWRKGGYREWQARLEVREIAKGLGKDPEAGNPDGPSPSGDILARWLAARFAVLARNLPGEEEKRWRRLRELVTDVSTLRRGDHRAARLEIERERRRVKPQPKSAPAASVKKPADAPIVPRSEVAPEAGEAKTSSVPPESQHPPGKPIHPSPQSREPVCRDVSRSEKLRFRRSDPFGEIGRIKGSVECPFSSFAIPEKERLPIFVSPLGV